MLERIRYVNHLNEEISFGENGLFVNANDLHNFAWAINSQSNKISSFKKGITKKLLPVIVKKNNDEDGLKAKNDLFEICEKDVLKNKNGRLYCGEYYLNCFITEGKASDYLYKKSYTVFNLTIQTDYPWWIKETDQTFGLVSKVGKDLDYNNDFPYDYSSNILNTKLINSDFTDTSFRMSILGPATDPKVTIGPNEYQVFTTLNSNEYVEIDSIEKTIRLIRNDGQVDNVFNKRNKESYIFEKIPSGESNISLSGDFTVIVTLLEERGVPKWI